MSTLKTSNVQVGQSGTASQNFTITTPSDGTLRISRGNAGATTEDALVISSTNDLQVGGSLTDGSGRTFRIVDSTGTVVWGS